MLNLSPTIWTSITSGGACLLCILLAIFLTPKRAEVRLRAGESWLLRAPLLPLVLAVVTGLLSIYALILHFAFGATDFKLPAAANVTSPVLVAATLIAGMLATAYAVLRLRAHLLAEAKGRLDAHGDERADESHRSEREVAFTERFAKAVALLAAAQPISRIAGAHLILAVGDEWSRDGAQQRCLDVLVSHLRALRENESFEHESSSRGVREEVRLITSETLRRLAEGSPGWSVQAGDFSGAVVADFDITGLGKLPLLDLQGTKVLGDLIIPRDGSEAEPKLTGLVCEGDLTIDWSDGWDDVDLSGINVVGSVSLLGKKLPGTLTAIGLRIGGNLGLGFESFEGDVIIDSAEIGGVATVGSEELGATFGTEIKSTMLSFVGASFQELKLRRSPRGPQVDLTDAVGAIDLSYSVFPLEVTANRLDASTGFHVRGSRFQGPLVLDAAALPRSIELDGLSLSESARNAISSSDFALRGLLLGNVQASSRVRPVDQEFSFDWRNAIEPLRERLGESLMSEIETRLLQIEADLPTRWHTRPQFTAAVMSAISRAAAKVDASSEDEEALQAALKRALPLSPSNRETE